MEQFPSILPVLPVRNAVLFPGVSMPLVVGRGRSIQAIDHAMKTSELVLVVAQRVLTSEDPGLGDLYEVGTVCRIETSTVSESGGRQIVVTGIARQRLFDLHLDPGGFLVARGESVSDIHSADATRNEALFYNLKEIAREVVQLLPGTTESLVKLIDRIEDSAYLTNVCAAYLNLSLSQRQEFLENVLVESRIEALLNAMQKEREILSIQQDIRDKMTDRLNKAQREAILREQLKTIRSELGEEPGEDAAEELEKKLREAQLPPEAQQQAQEEMKRLRSLPVASAEFHVVRTYLEWMAALPWNKRTESPIDLKKARLILDEDHYGLEEVKRRILQFLAVAKLKNDIHGPILCLVGPPGVGKTSLGQSIARALGRKFIRTSLGGVRDEAEIRGHRRTYVGALPGRIIQSIKRAGSRNPLMMLDEIDKLRSDYHGDPSSAMLEVLDPEQNKAFTDHYIDVPFDLSDVFFVTTANVVDTIPAALRDRMELIEVNSYTSYEKIQIAQKYLVPKLLKEHGLREDQVEISGNTLQTLINQYTREAGVRELQRKIAAVFRAVAEKIVLRLENQDKNQNKIEILADFLREILGPEKYFPELTARTMKPGVATGLAWTPHGGDLIFVEATAVPAGKGHLILTGQLGEVMKESAHLALSLTRSTLSSILPIHFDFGSHDIHIHVPAGSIPKDGPSAGVTLFVALASLVLNKSISPTLAMTGEITLRGVVLPVGGIKEKVLAAHRSGVKRIILSRKNQPDLAQVPDEVRNQMEYLWVETVEEVLEAAFSIKPSDVFFNQSAA
jgi:ATP-dependent Lon protease